MKGFLSFLILWILKKEKMSGAEIAKELEKRKGHKPSPGTLYPALKDLREQGFISCDKDKVYTLTKSGEKELESACKTFHEIFYDAHEMHKCCKK